MNTQTAQVDDLQLVALRSAVNCTDIFVRFSLTEWSLRELADEAAAAASHLVSTVVETANPDSPGFLTVRLRLRGDHLVIEVEDRQDTKLPDQPPDLRCERAGVEPLNGPGKRVWCELALPGGVNAAAVPLPQRERRKSPTAQRTPEEPTEEVAPEVIERLLSGLKKDQ